MNRSLWIVGSDGWKDETRKKRIMDTPDSHELDALSELSQSDGWKQVAQRINREIERKRDSLERPRVSGESYDFDRGFIAGIRMVLTIPEILSSEIKIEARKA